MIIKLKSIRNVRDIAYLNMKEGKLFRGESLYKASKKDLKILYDKYQIRTIIDLRTNQEHKDKPNKIYKDINYYHIPLITMEEMGATSEKEGKRRVLKEHKLPDIHDYYEKLVNENRKEVWSKLFDILLNNNEGAIYFHCTVGKDRSGIVSAIILSLLGINKEIIYQDYLLTNQSPIIPFSYKLFALMMDKQFRKEFMEYFKAKEEYLDSSFKYIDNNYQNIDNFYRKICSLDDNKINRLKELYLKEK